MKKTLVLATVTMLLAAGCSQSKEKAFVRTALFWMDRYGLYAEGPAWEEVRSAARAADPSSMEEAYEVTRQAVKAAGGKHSFLWTLEKQQQAAETDKTVAPSVEELDDGIVVITLPGFSGQTQDDNRRYALSVIDALPDSLRGSVIDLRGNTGGNICPMICAVHPFLPDSVLLTFETRKRKEAVSREYYLKYVGIDAHPDFACPVALLTDGWTVSAAEMTLLSFRGLERTRVFGMPTAGYVSGNVPYSLPAGAKLVLTISRTVARTGEVFCDDPIAPDVTTDHPLEDALAWIRR